MKTFRRLDDNKHLYVQKDEHTSKRATLTSLIEILTLKGCSIRDKMLESDYELYTLKYDRLLFAISISNDDELISLCVDNEKDLASLEKLLS